MVQQCTQLKLALVPVSARNLGKSYGAIFEKTPYMYRFNFFPQYGGTSEKIYFRKNVVLTKNLQTRLGQHCTQLQFGMLFIIVQNLEIFWRGIFLWTSMPKEITDVMHWAVQCNFFFSLFFYNGSKTVFIRFFLMFSQYGGTSEKSVFRPSKKNWPWTFHTNAHSSSCQGWYLFLSLRGILESLIAAFLRKHHTCTDFHFPLSMGVLARKYIFAKMLL